MGFFFGGQYARSKKRHPHQSKMMWRRFGGMQGRSDMARCDAWAIDQKFAGQAGEGAA
jgi:hypothetical protein